MIRIYLYIVQFVVLYNIRQVFVLQWWEIHILSVEECNYDHFHKSYVARSQASWFVTPKWVQFVGYWGCLEEKHWSPFWACIHWCTSLFFFLVFTSRMFKTRHKVPCTFFFLCDFTCGVHDLNLFVFLFSLTGNYRPVSQLQFLGKLLERCCLSQVQDYFTSNELYSEAQSACRLSSFNWNGSPSCLEWHPPRTRSTPGSSADPVGS